MVPGGGRRVIRESAINKKKLLQTFVIGDCPAEKTVLYA
jgi:hypothetical protein